MSWLAGADGCPAGWICVLRDTRTGAVRAAVHRSARALLDQRPVPAVLALDIPIGLTEAGPRRCDQEARRLLGPVRGTSVFPAPVRAALAARTREQACRLTEQADGRRMGCQAWNIVPRIRAVDALLTARPALRERVREVHPEVSFAAWNGGRPLVAPKRRREGRALRRRLTDAWLGAEVFEQARALAPRRELGDDDILDALAALWTAHRVARGEAVTLPADPPRDARGLPMAIVY